MATGLLALLDDVAAITRLAAASLDDIAKVAAASLDDVAAQAGKAGAKAAGVVIDDAAVTPRYVVGFAAEPRAADRAAHRARVAEEQAGLPAARRAGAQRLRALGDHAAAGAGRRLPLLRGRGEGLARRSPRTPRTSTRRRPARRRPIPRRWRKRKVAGRDPHRLHPLGRDHGDRAGDHAGTRLRDAGGGAGRWSASASPSRSMARWR